MYWIWCSSLLEVSCKENNIIVKVLGITVFHYYKHSCMFLFVIAYLFIVRRLCSAFFVVYTCIRGGCFILFLKWKEQITTILQFAFNLGCFVVVVLLNTQWRKCAYFFVIKRKNVFFPLNQTLTRFWGVTYIGGRSPTLYFIFWGISEKKKSLFFFFVVLSFEENECVIE